VRRAWNHIVRSAEPLHIGKKTALGLGQVEAVS
jgi:CRISPR/Cas system endoribonuclease Cas6 (RAMP superfamily)